MVLMCTREAPDEARSTLFVSLRSEHPRAHGPVLSGLVDGIPGQCSREPMIGDPGLRELSGGKYAGWKTRPRCAEDPDAVMQLHQGKICRAGPAPVGRLNL